jgi:hypothetical protein
MKWISKYRKREELEKNKATRIISRFLFFPKEIKKETRWLETATFEQLMIYSIGGLTEPGSYHWQDINWIN